MADFVGLAGVYPAKRELGSSPVPLHGTRRQVRRFLGSSVDFIGLADLVDPILERMHIMHFEMKNRKNQIQPSR